MRPKWFSEREVPFADMWPDDHLWYPLMLGGDKFYGYFLFDGMDTILNSKLTKVDRLEDIVVPESSLGS